MTMPNFFLIGAAKSGTTALYSYLSQHPEVFLPDRKEPHFFSFRDEILDFKGPGVTLNKAITSIECYRRLFDEAGDARAVGDCSTSYLYVPEACNRIFSECPNAKIIAILRNPVDRAYSSYMHLVREGREPAGGFAAALSAEQQRIRDGWGFLWRYVDVGLYSSQLARYFELFRVANMRVYLYEDLVSAPDQLVADIFSYLGVDASVSVDTSSRPNASGAPRSAWLQKLLNAGGVARTLSRKILPRRVRWQLRDWYYSNALQQNPMESEIRTYLKDIFREDIERTQDLISRDLSHWLE